MENEYEELEETFPPEDRETIEEVVTEPVETEPVTEPVATEYVPETDASIVVEPEQSESTEATIYEDFSGVEYEETTEVTEQVVTVEVLESVGSDIAHASLFSGFLVSGTLVGIFLLRKIYGT